MSSKKTILNIIISIVVIVAAVFAYRLFFPAAPAQTPASPGSLLTVVTPSSPLEPSDQFLSILLSLQEIKFQKEVFDKITQNQLQDFSTELILKDPGRPNPFAPIGSGGSLVVATGTASRSGGGGATSTRNR